jgi:hypothetical protein
MTDGLAAEKELGEHGLALCKHAFWTGSATRTHTTGKP